jgi:asparagine synthase (glutamine-hydrolysing)
MCGISGFFGKEKISKDIINSSLNLMKNRGPDFQDYKEIKVNNYINLYFLHSRLSILDLKERSNQPFKKKHIVLIFNGEIYNYKEIRINLEKYGYKFSTESDTEVLANAYLHYGENCVIFSRACGALQSGMIKLKNFFYQEIGSVKNHFFFIKKKMHFILPLKLSL